MEKHYFTKLSSSSVWCLALIDCIVTVLAPPRRLFVHLCVFVGWSVCQQSYMKAIQQISRVLVYTVVRLWIFLYCLPDGPKASQHQPEIVTCI